MASLKSPKTPKSPKWMKKLDEKIEAARKTLVRSAEGMEEFGWEFAVEQNGVTVSTCNIKETGLRAARGVVIAKAPMNNVIKQVRNIKNYKVWNEQVIESKTEEVITPRRKIQYVEYDGAMGVVSKRDVCFVQDEIQPSPMEYIILWHSFDIPSVPKRKGYVRANFLSSGYVLHRHPQGTLVTFVLQFDLKGWLPSSAMNAVCVQQPLFLGNMISVFEERRAVERKKEQEAIRKAAMAKSPRNQQQQTKK